jgi:hypothetical protein
LYENGHLFESLEHTSNGLYTSSSEAQEGMEYKCEVSVPGYELVSATTIVPLVAPIKNVKFIKNAWFNYWGDLQWRLLLVSTMQATLRLLYGAIVKGVLHLPILMTPCSLARGSI